MRQAGFLLLLVAGIVSTGRRGSTPPGPLDAASSIVPSPPSDLPARFDHGGAHVVLGGTDAALTAVALGRHGLRRPLDASGPARVARGEVRIPRGDGVTEWWRSSPGGLEHGVTIDARPPGDGELVIEVAVTGGLSPAPFSSDSVDLRDARGRPVASYTHLAVIDADGARLPARMSVADGRIALTVDDGDARYPIVVDPLLTAQVAALQAPDGANFDALGHAVSLSADGTVALVGAPSDDTGAELDSGSARVFVRTGTTWSHEATLVAPDASFTDSFGSSVALSADGSVALVGSPQDDVALGPANAGSAHVFVRTGTAWTHQAALRAFDAAVGDGFGWSVALSSDASRALIGVRSDVTAGGQETGSARVFSRTGTTWSEEATLIAPDASAFDALGMSVALSSDGDHALVGAWGDDTARGTNAGSARTFLRTGTTWAHEATLVPASGVASEGVGFSTALSASGDRALVGSWRDLGGTPDRGTAYVFRRTGTTWMEEAPLAPPDLAANDGFGYAVSLSSDGSRALAGVFGDDTPAVNAGSARVFVRTGTTWAHEAVLLAPDGAAGDRLGASVSLAANGSLALAGAYNDEIGASYTGSARVFSVLGTDGAPCAGDAACASGFCTDGVCCDARCGGGASDCQACSATRTGGADGTCAPLSATVAPTVECRSATDVCDVAETCDSTSVVCPADSLASAGTECRAVRGICDVAESCTGTATGCPTDAFASITVVCRAAATTCDVAETCDGASATCAGDDAAPMGTVCRTPAGACDAEEVCDGSSHTCPGDARVPAGVGCGGSGLGSCSSPGVCDGAGVACPGATLRPAGTVCLPRNPASGCDVDDVCDGLTDTCRAAFAGAGAECAPSSGQICDAPDHCTGASGECPAEFVSGVECRASVGSCDPAEFCAGGAPTCPPDAVAPIGTACRVASDPSCDPEEVCDGAAASCPIDVTACAPDAGRGPDAGRAPDSGETTDAGAPADDAGPPSVAVEGCSCRVGSGRAAPRPLVALVALVALSLRSGSSRRSSRRGCACSDARGARG